MNIEWNKVTWYSKIAAVIVFVATFGIGFWLGTMKADKVYVDVLHITDHSRTTKEYKDPSLGVSFSYPLGYILTERELGDAHRRHYNVTLIKEEESHPPLGGEGPPAVTLDFYQNDLDKQTLLGWLHGSNESNFKLSNGIYASTTVKDNEAVAYRWSGLYEGETTAFIHGKNIIAVSVTYLNPEDKNIEVYRSLLGSLRF